MKLYTIWYKKPGWWFWRKIKNVKWDGAWWNNPQIGNGMTALQVIPLRVIILADDTRIEFPTSMIFKFDEKRMKAVEGDIHAATGI